MRKSFRLALWFVCIGILIGALVSAADKTRGQEKAQGQSKAQVKVAKIRQGSSVAPCDIYAPITVGQSLTGQLSAGDCTFDDGSYVDFYSFSGTAGQQIAISLNSSTFDAALYLFQSNGRLIAEDDDGGGGTNARIPPGSGFFSLPAD